MLGVDPEFLKWPVEEPFRDVRWQLWLTADEWRLLYGLGFAMILASEEHADASVQHMMGATALLLTEALEWKFEGLAVAESGELLPKQGQAVEPRNLMWLMMLSGETQTKPDLKIHVERAAELVRAAPPSEAREGLLEILDHARAHLREAVAAAHAVEPPEEAKQYLREREAFRRQALAALAGTEGEIQ
jgi:hypothetical protein